ncbi:MAG TPA: aminopeptidase [candidate division Zixibacteria bacterium]|nr:aminopeptidase [candidate division Zixibacteria bacterium]
MQCRLPLGSFIVMMMMTITPVISTYAGDGALTPELVSQIQDSFEMDAQSRAVYNAITNNDVNELALNHDLLRQHNELFSHKIKAIGITNQKSSGRCWLFAGLNLMRPIVIEKHKLNGFEFSQNYLAFWDKMEKANCFLEHMIEFRDRDPLDREMEILLRDPISDGGWWEYVVALVNKYGVVPKEVMPETNSSEKTDMMNNLIGRKLRADAVKIREMAGNGCTVDTLRAEKQMMLAEVYRMLVLNLGEPPAEFQWRYEEKDSTVAALKSYTPKSFFDEFVNINLEEYVSIFNDPAKELGKHYQISLSRNIYDGRDIDYVTVESSMLKDIAAKSVLADEPVWFACDVGKDQDSKHGIMAMSIYDYGSIYGINMDMTKAQRSLYRESTPNHAMVFVGVDIKDDKPVKWQVENSWGSERGASGYWTLYDSWFDNHVYEIIVKKQFVSKDILKSYDQPAIVVPPWDPMFEMMR